METVNLVYYGNVHNNNADLPEFAVIADLDPQTVTTDSLKAQPQIRFSEILASHQLYLAPTQFSTSAPLKVNALKYGFRAATMPGFSPAMLPALKLDYDEVGRRVSLLTDLLDLAVTAEIEFTLDKTRHLKLSLDLRFRTGHNSSGRFPKAGTAGNLPSGESYIVPYEGEQKEPSLSNGQLPVQFENEIVIYDIKANKAVSVSSTGARSQIEAEKIQREPAYANLAELGLGVLGDFGVKPIGEILLDEKLGLHIAFGRSDHFGGAVGVADFSSPEAVEHSDRIYLPETMPRVAVNTVVLFMEDGTEKCLMSAGSYCVF